MNFKLIALALFIFLNIGHSKAQMAAAKKVEWSVNVELDVPIERDSLWSLLKDYTLVSKLSEGYVTSIVNKDNIQPILREVTFADGSKREELLKQVDEQHRFLAFDYKDTSLPKGIKDVMFAFFTKELDDSNSRVSWLVRVEGDKDAKDALIKRLNIEMQSYRAGYSKYLNAKPKVVEMMRMN
ncbi:SRPBCC family protein [Sphingobacterium yanglingense]|uniref:Polyketide cyclase/dehydrase/lipid transport protein n=1 Tax=Sphingobacterium yanglingense TaxID=1437280 RepID=A0A4R6WDH0_9SPHI|nr:hypothetical protein [Sphingobacterium yanglingense]TDQ75387.1 hypothetical protein CLV99_3992 [Sphingobacterium yanglingense]